MASRGTRYRIFAVYLIIGLSTDHVLTGVAQASNQNDYWLSNAFKTQDQAVEDCERHAGRKTYRLIRISTKAELEKAQNYTRRREQGSGSKKKEYWTALSFTSGRGPNAGWKWDGRDPAQTPNRNLTLSIREQSVVRGKYCFYFNNNTKLNRELCTITKRVLCEKMNQQGVTSQIPTGLPSVTSGHTSSKQKAKNIMSEYLTNLQKANVEQPDSMQYVLNETAELFTSLREENMDPETIDVMFATQKVESFAVKYAKTHLQRNSTKPTIMADKQLVLSMEAVQANRDDDIVFPPTVTEDSVNLASGTFIKLPAKLFTKERIVVNLLYQDMKNLVSNKVHDVSEAAATSTATRLNSAIIASTLDPATDHVLPEEEVRITLQHLTERKAGEKPLCVFWDFEAKVQHNGTWSTRGCAVVESHSNKTTCSCNHLTNFAVLMQVSKSKLTEVHQLALSIITYIGCALSLVGETLTIIAYTLFSNSKAEQSQIRVNLVVSLALAQIVFLSGINATKHVGACIFVAVLIHYFYLVAFCWMLIEGMYLYLMVVKVFNTVIKMRRYYLFAWGFPLLMVLVSLVIAATLKEGLLGYLHNQFCWVSFENNLVWTFVAPVLLVCFLNTVILVRVLHEITRLHSSKGRDVTTVKQGLKACATLFPLLGLTWVFGVLSVTEASLVFQYIFTIFNSFQGFFVFVFHVARNHEIRQNIKRKKEIWTTTRSSNFGVSARSNPDYSMTNTVQKIDVKFPSTESMNAIKNNQVLPSSS